MSCISILKNCMYKRNEYKNKNVNVNLIHTKFLKKYKKSIHKSLIYS